MRMSSWGLFRSAAGGAVLTAALAAACGFASAQPATGNSQQTAACACQLPAEASGIVESVSGNVFVSQANGSTPARPSMRLRSGDAVLVGPQSASTVVFGERCKLHLRANTTFEVRSQGELLCLAINGNGAEAGAVAQAGRSFVGPAILAGGIGIGVIAIAASDKDKAVSK